VERVEAPYSAKDISLSLDIGDSTLRKWCLALEEHKYEFYRTDQNKRLFTEKDIIVLKHFQVLVKDKNMSMQNAALIVTSRFKKEVFSNETDVEQIEEEMNIVPAIRSQGDLIQLLVTKIGSMEEQQERLIQSLIEKQTKEIIEVNRALVQKMDEQQKYIEERLNKRDELLLQSIREAQETKQHLLQIATAQEEQKKRGFFARLFGK
jgi:hypothetical protein